MEPILTAFQLPYLGWLVRVQAYPLAHLLALGSLVGATTWLYSRRVGAAGPAVDVLLVAIPAGLLGSVVLGAGTSGSLPPLRLDALWSGYRAAYGGLLAGGASAWAFARWRGVPVAVFLDCAAPGLAAGALWCRLGCFLAGCCWGRPTKGALGLAFPFDHPAMLRLPADEGWGLLPTQLYLAAAAAAILAVLVAARRPLRRRPGGAFALAALLYAVATFLVEFLRADPGRRFVAGLSHNQWISLAIVAVVALWLVRTSVSGVLGSHPPSAARRRFPSPG